MNIFKRYIEKQPANSSINNEFPETEASIFVVIPSFNEPDIISTINSLSKCYPPKSRVAVIIVVNSSEDSHPTILAQNLLTLKAIGNWKQDNQNTFLDINYIHATNLSRKFAGVGWARKIGMDEAIKQLERTGQNDGIIVSLDADCKVLPNYLRAIEQSFEEFGKNNFVTIYFSHPTDSPQLSDFEREGIIRYELHMRYYRNAMEWCGYPHSIHTVGSSFAVRASAYVKQGGMNRKKAGEDFYFLHKMVFLGPYGNIGSTAVFPSARISDRVPFGTGAAMKKWHERTHELKTTYSFDSFLTLKPFFEKPEQFLGLNKEEINSVFRSYPDALMTYLKESETCNLILEIQANCSSRLSFVNRFFNRFNAFWILKYLNFVHNKYFNRGDLCIESYRMLSHLGIDIPKDESPVNILHHFRELDRKKS